MGVVKRWVLRGLWRRLVGVGNRAGVLRGSGLLHGSSGTWVSEDLQGHSKSRGQGYADVHG